MKVSRALHPLEVPPVAPFPWSPARTSVSRCAVFLVCCLASFILAWPRASQAASRCDISMRLDALTVSSNVLKAGFPALLPNAQNPTIYFRKKVEIDNSINNSCYVCHETGRRTTSDTWAYDPETGRGPTNFSWSGQITYRSETNGQAAIDCASTRIAPDLWDNPFCDFIDPAPSDIVVSNRTESSYQLVRQQDSRELIQLTNGSAIHEIHERSSLDVHLSQPYSLADFVSAAEPALAAAPWPDWSRASRNGYAERGGRQVLQDVSADRAELRASLTKLKYRIAVRGPRDQRHTVAWIERFTPNGGGTSVDTPFTEQITFNGQEQFLAGTGGEQGKTLDPPAHPGTIDVIVVGNWACQSQACRPGKGTASTGSIDVRINLGQMASGETAGFLLLHEEQPAPDLASPARLQAFAHRDLELIKDGGVLRQIKTPQTLVLIVPDGSGYEIRFHPGAAGRDANGYYRPSGQPDSTWRIESPYSDPHRLRVVQRSAQDPLIHNFSWSESDQAWALVVDGQRKEARSIARTGDLRTETFVIRELDDRLVFRQARTWKQYGGVLGELLIHEQIGPVENPLETSWSYYDHAPNSADYGKVRSISRTEGGREEYEYDSAGRLSVTRAPYANTPAGRVTSFLYAPVDPLDDGTIEPTTPRTTIETVLAHETQRTYVSVRSNQTLVIRCLSPGAPWDDPSNLITTNRTVALPDGQGAIQTVMRPDGTLEVSRQPAELPGVPRVESVTAGAPNAQGSDVVDGTRFVTSWDAAGRVVAKEAFDVKTGMPISREVYHYPDAFGPVDRITFLDGSFVLLDYDCCHLASMVDQDGTVTTFGYDALDRLVAATRNGVSLLYSYDAADRQVLLRRQGTDGSLQILQQTTFDSAGRPVLSTDGASHSTHFHSGPAPGGVSRMETTTLPDGGSVAEVRCLDGSMAEIRGTAVKPVRYAQSVVNDDGVPRLCVRETRLADDGTELGEWFQTYFDLLGRPMKIVRSDGHVRHAFYNARGQLWKQRDFDGTVTLYGYNARGEVEYTCLDSDDSGTIDLAGNDRVTRTVSDYAEGRPRSRTYVWPYPGRDEPVLARSHEISPGDGDELTGVFGLTTAIRTERLGAGLRRVTETAPDRSSKVQDFADGRLLRFTWVSATGETLGRTNYSYDAHGRLSIATDARSGAAKVFHYDAADQVTKIVSPALDGMPASEVSLERDAVGRVTKQVLASGVVVANEYTPSGLLRRAFTDRALPVDYSYDSQGRLTNLVMQSAAGAVRRSWLPDGLHGWIVGTRHDNSGGQSFAYAPAGTLTQRTLGRGVTVNYGHNSSRDLTGIRYGDFTEEISLLDLDRLGRPARVLVGTNAASVFYHPGGRVISESFGDVVVTNALDSLLRPRTVTVRSQVSNQILHEQSLTYDGASRLQSVRAGALSVDYSYHPDSSLIRDVVFRHNGSLRLFAGRQFDPEGRAAEIAIAPSGGAALVFRYSYDLEHRRVAAAESDGSVWSYRYDPLGQLVAARKTWSDHTFVAGQQFEYDFDSIGNRTGIRRGGARDGSALRAASYDLRGANQYITRTVPAQIDLFGQAPVDAAVTVQGMGVARADHYFHTALPLNTATGATYLVITNQARRGLSSRREVGGVFLPSPTLPLSYDADGNLTSDGRWTFSWNAENRLTQIEALPDTPAPVRRKLVFGYDHRGRRVSKTVSNWNASATRYDFGGQLRFVYDGWRLVAELNERNEPLRSYVWGADLTGTRDGAGGVGGLLAMIDQRGSHPTAYLYAHDSIGNVRAMVSAEDGSVVARYDYGPFGELLRATGPMARDNPFRFSTRYQDTETELVCFGFRWYDPELGRWLSRDPIGEAGGLNLYAFVGNDPVNGWDALGLTRGAELLTQPKPLPHREVVPDVTVRRLVGPGGHQWFALGKSDGLVQVGVNKGADKGRWVDETSNRPRDFLENPQHYYEWEVVKRFLGWTRDGTPCQCMTVGWIRRCIGSTILFEISAGTPRPFNLICNNCRDNSERILRECCAGKGRLVHNPDGTNPIERFLLDWFVGPGVYAPLATGGGGSDGE